MPLILTFLTHVVIDARTQEHVSTHASAYEARGSFIEEQKDEWVKEADVIHNKCHSRGHVLSIATRIFEHFFSFLSSLNNALFDRIFVFVFFYTKFLLKIFLKNIFLNNIYDKSNQPKKDLESNLLRFKERITPISSQIWNTQLFFTHILIFLTDKFLIERFLKIFFSPSLSRK